jgi:hypothetical protein
MPIDTSTVIPFQRPSWVVPETSHQRKYQLDASLRTGLRWLGLKSVSGVRAVLCSVLFVILLWLRWPLMRVCRVLSGASVLTLPLLWLGLPDAAPFKTEMLLTLAGVGMCATALIWGYDRVLMCLSPGWA